MARPDCGQVSSVRARSAGARFQVANARIRFKQYLLPGGKRSRGKLSFKPICHVNEVLVEAPELQRYIAFD